MTIDLSHCNEFELGTLTVRPASREIVGAAAALMVEPKVMQLLVTLARQPGRVVSRDDFIDQCWDGRVVGEDAINRVIGKLRRAIEGTAAGTVRIETVARVGLRLVATPVPAAPDAHRSVPELGPAEPPTLRATLAVPRTGLIAALAAAAMIAAIVALRETRAPSPAAPLPVAVTDLETRGLSAMFEGSAEQTAEGIAYLRRATDLAPRSAPVWGSLAMSYVLDLGWLPASERVGATARVRDAAAHALAIDPHEVRATAALVSLVPAFRQWDGKAVALRDAVRQARQSSGPLQYQEIQFLLAVGRTREASAHIEPLARASPLVPWIQATRILLLAAAGRLTEADRAADAASAIWPRDRLIWFTRFDLAASGGTPGRALAMAADRSTWPRQTSPAEILLAARTVRAAAARDPAVIDGVLRDYRATAAMGQAHAERAMRAAVLLGRPAAAIAFARTLYRPGLYPEPRATLLPQIGRVDGEPPTAALFLPPLGMVWTQPAFAALLRDLGLPDYWRRTGSPDICTTPRAAPLCRTMLARR